MKHPLRVTWAALALAGGCSTSSPTTTDAGLVAPPLNPGESCDPSVAPTVNIHFDPESLVLAPGESRPVRVVIDPDLCEPQIATFTVGDDSLVTVPASANFDLRHPTYDFNVMASKSAPATVSTTKLVVDAAAAPREPVDGLRRRSRQQRLDRHAPDRGAQRGAAHVRGQRRRVAGSRPPCCPRARRP